MDFYTQQAISDYFKNQSQQRQQPLYNPADYGKTEIVNPNWATTPKIDTYQPQQSGQVSSGDPVASFSSAANSIISAIATSVLAAQQDKAERELYNNSSELENKIFSGRLSTKEKQQELNNRVEANRSAFGASDLGIRTASNQNSINSNSVNNIVNALARAYLNKG